MVTDLATHLNVSSVTSRDLTDLEEKETIRRNHGKAILMSPISTTGMSRERKAVCRRKETDWNESLKPHHSQRFHIHSIGNNHACTRARHSSVDELTVITASWKYRHPGKRKEHLYYSTRRHIAAQQSVRGREICRKHIGRLFVQQAVYRRRRHRPRLRHHHYQYDGSEPQPRNDADCPENDSACGFLQVRTERFQQDCRYGRCRPHHYRLTHPAFHRFTPGRNGH